MVVGSNHGRNAEPEPKIIKVLLWIYNRLCKSYVREHKGIVLKKNYLYEQCLRDVQTNQYETQSKRVGCHAVRTYFERNYCINCSAWFDNYDGWVGHEQTDWFILGSILSQGPLLRVVLGQKMPEEQNKRLWWIWKQNFTWDFRF
jgi:hypothetical protein